MKRRNIILTTISSLLALGSVAFASANTSKSASRSKAATISGGQLYVQITDISQLTSGCTVALGSGSMFLGSLGGNPIYSYGYSVSGANSDYSKFYFSGVNIIPMEVSTSTKTVIDENEQETTVTVYHFKSVKTNEGEYSYRTNGRYLSYGNEYKEVRNYQKEGY